MPTITKLFYTLVLASSVAIPTAWSQTCEPDVRWQHEHATPKSTTVTTDVKGTRATIIEACRSDDGAATQVAVEVKFEGSRTARALAPGACTDKLAKWAVIRSQGNAGSDGAGNVSGVYRVCKE